MGSLSRKDLSRELKSFVETDLAPDKEWEGRGRQAANAVFTALKEFRPSLGINRVSIGGSVGKGTAIGETDFDLVIYLNDVKPPWPRHLLDNFKSAVENIPGYTFVKQTKHSVQFTLNIQGTTFDFDLLPAANLVSKKKLEGISDGRSDVSTQQAAAVRRRLKKYYDQFEGIIGYQFSSSLCEQTVLFLKKRPKEVVEVIKLARYWNKQVNMGDCYVSGRSYLIELVAVAAQRYKPGASLLQRFIRFLQLMKNFSTLKIVFGYHYNTDSVPPKILQQRPLILDPCNPYNNIAYRIKTKAVEMFEQCATDTLDLINSQEVYACEDIFEYMNTTEE